MALFFLFGFPLLFVGLWFAVTTVLRKTSGMTKRLDVVTGEPLRCSKWGSASVNGVAARNCIRLEEHPDGFMLRMMWIFGGGLLWLPKAGLEVGDERPKRLLFPRSLTLSSGTNRVILFDRLVDFVGAPSAGVTPR